MVLFLKEVIFREEDPNTYKNNIFNNTPIFLVKQSCKSIWAWSFCGANTRKGIEGMVQIVSFSSEEMEFSKRDNNSSGQGGFEVVKRDVK